MPYQMKFVPLAQLRDVPQGNMVAGLELSGTSLNITEKYVATVEGMVAVQDGSACVAGVFYTYEKLETEDRFKAFSYIDLGPTSDWRAPQG